MATKILKYLGVGLFAIVEEICRDYICDVIEKRFGDEKETEEE